LKWDRLVVGVLLTGMAVFNASCCGSGACSSSPVKNDTTSKEISYEEIK